jgi:hypothetical protein
MGGELLSKLGNFVTGCGPFRVASITVEQQRIGLQRRFEFVLCEFNSLVMVVRTYYFERQAVVHSGLPLCSGLPPVAVAEALVSNIDGSASFGSLCRVIASTGKAHL